MNREIRGILEENDIHIRKITLKGKVLIIDTDDDRFVIKKRKKDLNDLYSYLSSRSFDYFPKKKLESENYDIYEYIEDIEQPFEQNIFDMVNIVSLLHNKTTFYKNIDGDEYKKLYESIIDKVEYLYNYYNDLVDLFEREEYMSPSSYLFIRNVSKVFESLDYCRFNIDKWYDIINEKKRVRVVNLHNNLSIDHYIKNRYSYLISWDKSKRDLPIYDLIGLFDKYYYEVDFLELINQYERSYPLLMEERLLFFILIRIPDKILLSDSEYNNCLIIKKFYDKLFVSSFIVMDDEKK